MILSRRQALFSALAASATMVLPGVAQAAPAAWPHSRLPSADRDAIEDLFKSYMWAYDCNDLEAFLGLFTEDALVVGRGKFHRGKAAIADWFRYLLDMRDREGSAWLHESSQHMFGGDARRPIVYAYATHFSSSADAKALGVRSLGYFVGECERQNGRWLFRRFSISSWDRATLPWRKPLPWDDEAA